jgi:general stress protein 26
MASYSNIARSGEAVPVNLAYADTDKNNYLSVSGTARMNQDRQKLHELWSVWSEAWLPQGPDAKDVALIAVEPDDAKLWDAQQQADLRGQDAEGGRDSDAAR